MKKRVMYHVLALAMAGLLVTDVIAQGPPPKVESVNRPNIKCFCDEDRKGEHYKIEGDKLVRRALSVDAGAMIKFDLAESEFRDDTKNVGEACRNQQTVNCWARRRYFLIPGGNTHTSTANNSITPDRLPYCEKHGNTMGSGDCKKRP